MSEIAYILIHNGRDVCYNEKLPNFVDFRRAFAADIDIWKYNNL